MTPVAAARFRGRLGAFALGALVVVAACGAPAPTSSPAASPSPAPSVMPIPTPTLAPTRSPAPGPTGDAATVYRDIEDQVVAERGLTARQRLEPTILSADEVKVRIEEQFRKDNPAEEIAVAEETLKALGLLPAGASLGDLYIDLLGSQVAGFYDPETGEMVVVSKSGAIGAAEKVTFAHEFTHALQDQSFGLKGIEVDAVGQGDRSLGRLALVEGDATLLMSRWLARHLTAAELGELLQVDPDAQAQLARMPAILRETLLFPYQQGLVFANALWQAGGWEAVDRAFGHLPESTEQVLHPEKYTAAEKPVDVALDGAALAASLGSGWKATPEDTLGEFQLSIWLRENGVTAAEGGDPVDGWGGDRLVYLRGPDGAYGLVIDSRWDTQADADEFLAAAKDAIGSLPGASMVGAGGPRAVRIFAASDEATLTRLGRAIDAPTGG